MGHANLGRQISSSGFARNTTRYVRREDVIHQWHLIDVKGLVVGRVASRVALLLRGKHKADFTPHADSGDAVVIINAGQAILTGNKLRSKIYHQHTGYPGGLKTRSAQDILRSRFPERIIEHAIRGMMPDGPLAEKQLGRLRVYSGSEHGHAAQQPELIDMASLNAKNVSFRGLVTVAKPPFIEQVRDRLKPDFDAVKAEVRSLLDENRLLNSKIDRAVDAVDHQRASLGDFMKLSYAQFDSADAFRRDFSEYKVTTDRELKDIRDNTARTNDLLSQLLDKLTPKP